LIGKPPVLVLVPPTWIGGLGVMRSLGRLGVPVYSLRHESPSVVTSSRWCRGVVRAGVDGRPLGDPAAVVADLIRAGRRLGRGTVLIAGTDEWATFLAAHAEELGASFTFPQTPPRVVEALASKEGLYRLANEHGLPTPGISVPGSHVDATEAAATLRYPILVKPVQSRPHVTYKGIAKNPGELLAHYRVLEERPDQPNVLFQEYISGRDEDVWMFNGYFDEHSRCLAGFTGVKLRQLPAHMGHCSIGELRHNPELIALTQQFLGAVGYRGIVDIGYRFDVRDGRYKVLDINPRLGGAFRLFVDPTGLDVVRALYLDLTGNAVPAPVVRNGRRWFREDSELVAWRQYARLDGLTKRRWLEAYRGVEEASTFSLTDPLPFLVSMGLLVRATWSGRRQRRQPAGISRPSLERAITEHPDVVAG
jgi:predicted ATP-grasp superfamily ATP-dependent carboligase